MDNKKIVHPKYQTFEFFARQKDGTYVRELHVYERINPCKENNYVGSSAKLVERLIRARFVVVKRSQKYDCVHYNHIDFKPVYLRRVK